MKNLKNLTKISIMFFMLMLYLNCFSQMQRMAVLPSSMNYGNKVKTICIDYFREIPKLGEAYNNIISIDKSDITNSINQHGSDFQIEGLEKTNEMLFKDNKGNELNTLNNNQAIIFGQNNEKIPDRYLEFINEKIKSYNNHEFDEYYHRDLQKEIWKYNVLDNLGYLKNEGEINSDFSHGLTKFEEDWGSGIFYPKELTVASILQDINELNKTDGEIFKTFIITKSINNEYVVFDGPSKEIFRENDELKLAKFLGKNMDKNENAYFRLNNFESEEKEEALLSTIRIQPEIYEKNININSFPNDNVDILFSSKFKHKLSNQILEKDIKKTNFEGTEYFKTDFNIESEGEKYNFWNNKKELRNETTTFTVLSKKENVLRLFITKTNSMFRKLSDKISLIRFFNNFKKEIKSSQVIQNDKEFILQMRSQLKNLRINQIKLDKNFN